MTGARVRGRNRPEILVDATVEALALRGSVMLQAGGEARHWCAVCASVQGDLEVRIAEPRRGWRAWTPSAGERWLGDNGFTHRIDAWARPLRREISPRECAAILDDALSNALGLPDDATVQRCLVQPAAPDVAISPPADASYAEHLAAALTGLLRAGQGNVHVECGRPARPLAWIWLIEGELIVEIEARDAPGTDVEAGRFAASATAASETAALLSTRLQADFGCAQPDPLFIALVAAEPRAE